MNVFNHCLVQGLTLVLAIAWTSSATAVAQESDYRSAQEVLIKYCAGCHNADEINGEFRADQFQHLMTGGERGKVITPGSAESSRLIGLMKGTIEPKMPPDDEPAPSADEIQVIAEWINAGAVGPNGKMVDVAPTFPKLESKFEMRPITAIAVSTDGQFQASGQFQRVTITQTSSGETLQINDLPGKVGALSFSKDANQLLIGTGIDGVIGEAILYSLVEQKIKQRFQGPRDSLFSVTFSADENQIAAASYDKMAYIWDIDDADPVLSLKGHNDAVFEVAYAPRGDYVFTASADGTVKIWDAKSGQRIDTRGEPLKAQTTVVVDADGSFLYAAGDDNRIRKWNLETLGDQSVAQLVVARFAHEHPIVRIRLHPDGRQLISLDASGVVKFWDTVAMQEIPGKPEVTGPNRHRTQAIAVSKKQILIGTDSGEIETIPWPTSAATVVTNSNDSQQAEPANASSKMQSAKLTQSEELEPNDQTDSDNTLPVPFSVSSTISESEIESTDVDLFGFDAKQGEVLIVEARAASIDKKKRSPIDTKVEVLGADGKPVPRVLLQAVRDSYFTFRGKNSSQINDFRIHNWEEMKLGQLLYCNGEVVRLFHYPRGPDSGFNLFPNFGKRHTMFDTTGIAHALHEPCYVVEAHAPDAKLPSNGLPRFLINYVNDDDAERELGTDSRLTFHPPKDGMFFVRVSDSRGFGGDEFKYELTVRPARPRFEFKKVLGGSPTLIPGGYKRIGVEVDRIDGFVGDIRVEIENLPEGVTTAGPVIVEDESLQAFFVLRADSKLKPEDFKNDSPNPTIRLTADLDGASIVKTKPLGKLRLGGEAALLIALEPTNPKIETNADGIPVIRVVAGETATAKVIVQRRTHKGRINFGKENAANNAPFGAFVDNIGLNGLLITPAENERQFFIATEELTRKGDHLIFVEAAEAGKPSSNPVVLRIE
ncbi:MAG: c-type cytochrome domain-containing protein [Planctomycetota bacterium]